MYNILVGKHEGKRPLVRDKRRWKDRLNFKISLGETMCLGWAGFNWFRKGSNGRIL
jgi:hypothetical protein